MTQAGGARERVAVGVRDLRDDGGDRSVGGRDAQHLTAAQRRTPQPDQVRVDVIARTDVRDCGVPVVELALDVQHLAWVPVARAEVTVIERERRDTRGGEPPGRLAKGPVRRRTESVRHHYASGRPAVVGLVEPATAVNTPGRELAQRLFKVRLIAWFHATLPAGAPNSQCDANDPTAANSWLSGSGAACNLRRRCPPHVP
jgi:hypothetical protein